MAYIRKTDGLAREVAPYLSLSCRIADLLIDIADSGRGCPATLGQARLLVLLTAEAYAQAAAGTIQLVSHLPRPSSATSAWYGRDESHQPLPSVQPRTYRIWGVRVS